MNETRKLIETGWPNVKSSYKYDPMEDVDKRGIGFGMTCLMFRLAAQELGLTTENEVREMFGSWDK